MVAMSAAASNDQSTEVGLTLTHLAPLLEPNQWISDAILNAYGLLLEAEDVLFVSSLNWSLFARDQREYCDTSEEKLIEKRARRIQGLKQTSGFTRNWCKCRLLLFPIHYQGNHWRCLTVDLHAKKLLVWDSLYALKDTPTLFSYIAVIVYMLLDEATKAQYDLDWLADLTVRCCTPSFQPKQDNDWDCGLFTIKTLECVALQQPVTKHTVRSCDMADYREALFHTLVVAYDIK